MRTGIALGSNIEPRLAHLQSARRRISGIHSGTQPLLCSKVYETSPVNCPADSPPFLNAVLELSTEMEPQSLLRKIKSIERALGRPPSGRRNSPRVIDIDLLYCEDIVISSPSLTLPHPQIAHRRFVLQPLADIRPKLVLPNLSKSVEELLQELQTNECVTAFCNAIYS
jgi:2-amino-4-hydroxy-6-hydroxymethyldihydropteridine diphosphokinase